MVYLLTAVLSIGVVLAQSPAQKPNSTTLNKQKHSAAKAEPPKKKEKKTAQAVTKTKLHPEQERAYTQGYKTGAVRKP